MMRKELTEEQKRDPSYRSGRFITDPPWGLGGLFAEGFIRWLQKRLLPWLDKKGLIKEGGNLKKYLRTHSK